LAALLAVVQPKWLIVLERVERETQREPDKHRETETERSTIKNREFLRSPKHPHKESSN
jgi:hypothetical protein